MSTKKCFLWSELGEEWIGSTYIWSDVCIIIAVKQALAGGGGGMILSDKTAIHKIKAQLEPERYKRFIEIVCKVNGLTFREIHERKEKDMPEVTLVEIKAAIQSVTQSNVRVKQIYRL